MPRSSRPRRGGRPVSRRRADPLDTDRALSGVQRIESHADGDWYVRVVTGAAGSKTYRCPGCDHEIPPGVAHVVAWSADDVRGDFSALHDRRHWHRPCWAARAHRRPRR